MEKSDSIKELASALSIVQGKFKPAPMDKVNPFLKNKYADLGSIIESAKALMAENGLSVSQLVVSQAGFIGITTILMHKSGEWISGTATLPVSDEKGKSSSQVAGSIVTYLRRYSLASVLGIYADEDTDGNQPTKTTGTKEKTDADRWQDFLSASKATKAQVKAALGGGDSVSAWMKSSGLTLDDAIEKVKLAMK